MGNDLSVFQNGDLLPSYLKDMDLDETTKALAGGGTGNKRISIRGSTFRMVVGGKEVAKNENRAMNVVVVKAAEHVSRQFYAKKWDPDSAGESPDCWSSDGKTPDKTTSTPQAANCALCPQNVAGSGQGESRACRYQQRLAVVLEGDMGGDVYQLSLPATSIFGDAKGAKMPLQAYGRFLAGHGVPVTAVVTEMRFDTDSEAPKLTFRPIRPLTEEEYLTCKGQSTTADAGSAVTILVAKRDSEKTAAEQAPATFQEPATRVSKKPAAPTKAQTTIADVLSSWDNNDDS